MCLCLWALPIWGQSDFFYSYEAEKVYLQPIPNYYQLEYPHGVDSINNIVLSNLASKRVGARVYVVHEDDLDTVNMYNDDYFLQPLYGFSPEDSVLYRQVILLAYKPDIDSSMIPSLETAHDLELIMDYPPMRAYRIPLGQDALAVSRAVFETNQVDYCTPDFLLRLNRTAYIPNDPFFAQQWYLHNTGQGTNNGLTTTANADIDAPEAWNITKGDSSIFIAVIDDGVVDNHPDLPSSRQLRFPGSNIVYQYDGSNDPDDPSPQLDSTQQAHGMACAGIIAATQDNNEGITGIAPNCKIMPVKILYDDYFIQGHVGFDAISQIVAGVAYARSWKPHVISMSVAVASLPTPQNASRLVPLYHVIKNALDSGMIIVCAAGNVSTTMDYPARFKESLPNLMAIGASERHNNRADYSPIELSGTGGIVRPVRVDFTAPSHTSFPGRPWFSPNESLNIWTTDIPGFNYGYNAWKGSLWALPAQGEMLPSSNSAYTGRFGGTSAAAPQVAGTIALMLSVNPCLIGQPGLVKDILKATCDTVKPLDGLKHNGPKNDWSHYYYRTTELSRPYESNALGHGKINAHRAVLAAQAMQSSTLDLYIKDTYRDIGLTGANGTGSNSDLSPDIWVRETNDGFINQVGGTYPNDITDSLLYCYVRVRNKSCVASTGTEELALYWSMAASWNSWPQNWDGTKPDTGNLVGRQYIPILQPGEDTILEFPYTVVRHANGINFCLLARIESSLEDTITVHPLDPSIPSWGLSQDISQNNNIAQLNVRVLSFRQRRGVVLVGNAIPNAAETFNVRVRVPEHHQAWTPDITKEAELVFTFDSAAWSIFDAANAFNQEGVEVLTPGKIRLTLPDVTFSNLNFAAGQREAIEISYNFLASELTDNTEYAVEITQMFSDSPTVVLGTQTYYIIKDPRDPIWANAGGDKTMAKNSSIELQAQDVGEPATYNWYDQSGNLLHTGRNFTVSPNSTESYKLEVIADLDGLKDYDEVEVKVNPYAILSLTPNPASNQVLVEYDAEAAQTAYLMLSQPLSGQYHNYLLDPQHSQISLQISHLPSGIYTLILVCNGEAVATRSLQISH